MKKLIFLIIVFINTNVFSQSFNRVYKSVIIQYDGDKWVDKESNYPEKMFVILDGSEIKITNEANTKLVTYGDPKVKRTDEGVISIWDAYDKDGKSCRFYMYVNKEYEQTSFTIFYADLNYGVEFYTTKANSE